MTLTLLALILAPWYLKMVLDPKGGHKLIKKGFDDARGPYVFFMFLLALMIFSTTGLNFAWEWSSLLSWLGAIIFVKAVILLFLPEMMEKKFKKISVSQLPILGFLGLLLMLGIVYLDLQVLA